MDSSPFLLLLFFSTAVSLPLAPAPPDFNADFSKRAARSDLMAVVDEDELQSLRHNGFQAQLRHLREKTVGRDPAAVTEQMMRNSIEDISEFSLDSSEVDAALKDFSIPSDSKMKKSSKFAELAQIHNTDSSNKALPPFAFSEDAEEDAEEKVETAEVVTPATSTVVLITLPTTTPSTTTTTASPPTTSSSTTTTTTSAAPIPLKMNLIRIDSDVEVPRRASVPVSPTVVPIQMTTTTLPPPPSTTTIRYSPPTRTQSPHIFSSSTVRLPTPITLASASVAPRAAPIIMTTPRPYRGAPFTTEFTIEPVRKRSEGGVSELRERIRSTSQLLNLLGDKIEGIDQQMTKNGPKTGVLANIYDRGEVKRRNYRNKQWGRTGAGRQGVQTYDGQFSGVAYGATKQRGGGYTMRKKMAKRPWRGGYTTRRLGERRPAGLGFLEKKTTEVAVEPYGSKRRGEWIRGVKQSERRNAVRRVSEKEKSFAQALLESEEASMKQLKKTLREIRDVVRFKTSSTTAVVSTTTPRPQTVRHIVSDDSFFTGNFDFRRRRRLF